VHHCQALLLLLEALDSNLLHLVFCLLMCSELCELCVDRLTMRGVGEKSKYQICKACTATKHNCSRWLRMQHS